MKVKPQERRELVGVTLELTVDEAKAMSALAGRLSIGGPLSNLYDDLSEILLGKGPNPYSVRASGGYGAIYIEKS